MVRHGVGRLFFDVADLVKDAIVLPWSFVCAKQNFTEQEFRQKNLTKNSPSIRHWILCLVKSNWRRSILKAYKMIVTFISQCEKKRHCNAHALC